MLSYYALADRESMRKSFLRLLDVQAEVDDLDKLLPEVFDLLLLILTDLSSPFFLLLSVLFFFIPMTHRLCLFIYLFIYLL